VKVPQLSKATVSRLPVYVDCLARLAKEGAIVVSSQELARSAGVSAAQLRKDLSYLGDFGTRGVGYEVQSLLWYIAGYLGLTRQWSVAIVGYGQLGAALARYQGFLEKGFQVVAVFDADPQKVGTNPGGVEAYPVQNLREVIQEKKVDMAIIATPAEVAQEVANQLVAAGVKSILNFAPLPLAVPKGVVLRSVDLATEMQILSFYETLRGEHQMSSVETPNQSD
jgi:redox-sensing transcriptional repressor